MRVLLAFVMAGLVLFAACGERAEIVIEPSRECRVLRVHDADTITVDCLDENIRLLLVDAPEVSPAECFGIEARDYLRSRLPAGTVVAVERGVLDRDRFGRYLRYVFLGDELLNETLVREGWAVRYRAAEDTRYRDPIAEAETAAEREGLGLWSACGG